MARLQRPNGLGTSSARIKPPKPRRLREDHKPHLVVPWSARINPEVERMRQHSLSWARFFGIATTDAEVHQLDLPRFDRLAAYAYPDAKGLRADLASDWMIWFFPFDDSFDGPIGDEPALARSVIDPMIRYAYGDEGALPIDAPPLIRAFIDLCTRSRLGMSATWQNRFAEDLSKYLFSNYLEAVLRRRQDHQMPHLLEVRRDSIGIRPSIGFGENVVGYELAMPLALSETFHQLRKLCADIVVVQNDAYSLDKDLRKGDPCNQAVKMMRDCGMTAQEAIHQLERIHENLIEEYCDREATALTTPDQYGYPISSRPSPSTLPCSGPGLAAITSGAPRQHVILTSSRKRA